PVRAVVDPTAHAFGALRRADRTHPVVGPADADLGCARARRSIAPGKGFPDPELAAAVLPASAGTVGVLADVVRFGYRLREQPGADVPAVADGGPAVPVRELDPVRALRARRDENRCVRTARWYALGYPARTEMGNHRGADLRRDLQPWRTRRAGGVDPLPDRASRRTGGTRRRSADPAALACAGKQVAGSPVRARRHCDRRRGQHRTLGHRGPRGSAEPAGTDRATAGLRR